MFETTTVFLAAVAPTTLAASQPCAAALKPELNRVIAIPDSNGRPPHGSPGPAPRTAPLPGGAAAPADSSTTTPPGSSNRSAGSNSPPSSASPTASSSPGTNSLPPTVWGVCARQRAGKERRAGWGAAHHGRQAGASVRCSTDAQEAAAAGGSTPLSHDLATRVAVESRQSTGVRHARVPAASRLTWCEGGMPSVPARGVRTGSSRSSGTESKSTAGGGVRDRPAARMHTSSRATTACTQPGQPAHIK